MWKHPLIAKSFAKEVHFFDIYYKNGVEWYKSHFPTKIWKKFSEIILKKTILAGEATPYYLFHPHAPKRISEILPDIKLIVMLRNPVDRTYSHYQHEVRKGREKLSFIEAVSREKASFLEEKEKMARDEEYYSFNHHRFFYLARGIYVEQLKTWMNLFSKDQLLIIRSEDFYSKTPSVLKRVFTFLNLPNWDLGEYPKFNPGNYEKMDNSIRDLLTNYFRPYNQQLYEFLGTSFDWD